MMNNPILKEDRDRMLYDSRSEEHDWLNPIAMQTLKEAVDKKASLVRLSDVQYIIEYQRGRVFLKRADGGFVPRGYIELHRLNYFDFDSPS